MTTRNDQRTFSPDEDVSVGISRQNIAAGSKRQTQHVLGFVVFLQCNHTIGLPWRNTVHVKWNVLHYHNTQQHIYLADRLSGNITD